MSFLQAESLEQFNLGFLAIYEEIFLVLNMIQLIYIEKVVSIFLFPVLDLVLLLLKLEQLHNSPQHLTTIISPRQHSLNDELEYGKHFMYGLKGSSYFCFPESTDVSRDEVEGNIRAYMKK